MDHLKVSIDNINSTKIENDLKEKRQKQQDKIWSEKRLHDAEVKYKTSLENTIDLLCKIQYRDGLRSITVLSHRSEMDPINSIVLNSEERLVLENMLQSLNSRKDCCCYPAYQNSVEDCIGYCVCSIAEVLCCLWIPHCYNRNLIRRMI